MFEITFTIFKKSKPQAQITLKKMNFPNDLLPQQI